MVKLKPPITKTPTKPWEQQERESARAYNAFRAYMDMGPGTKLRELAEALEGKESFQRVKDWSTKFDWTQRIREYNNHLMRIEMGKKEKETELLAEDKIKIMREKHLKIAMGMQSKALKKLQEIDPSRDITVGNMIKLLVEGVRIERICLGEQSGIPLPNADPSESQMNGKARLRELSLDQLVELEQSLARVFGPDLAGDGPAGSHESEEG